MPKNKKIRAPKPVKQSSHRSVNIRQAENGFVVSTYSDNGGEKTMIAKTKSEAKKQANKMLGL